MFTVIGGTASTLVLEEGGLNFRATKDIDIVLHVEALTPEFIKAFWDFVEDGGYENIQQSTGKRLFYRFCKPANNAYPVMVELFSRKPDSINIREGSHLTPIPVDEEVASLSAILLDDAYYALARNGGKIVDGIPVLRAEYLIPFKGKAWLDLSQRRNAGERIDERNIRKHKNDVFRLYQIIPPDMKVKLPLNVASDFRSFLSAIEGEGVDLAPIGVKGITLADALEGMREIYLSI